MNILNWLRGRAPLLDTASAGKSTPAASTQFASSQNSRSLGASPNTARKELLRVVLREMLTRNGIPMPWIGADALVATSSRREPGIHVRMLIRHWDARLLNHSFALQQDFERRLLALDPDAGQWLMGISWQYALPPETEAAPLPHPGSWTADPVEKKPEPAVVEPAGGTGDVISGPVRITTRPAPLTAGEAAMSDARADLERLLAIRDADLARHAASAPHGGFAPTEPSPLR